MPAIDHQSTGVEKGWNKKTHKIWFELFNVYFCTPKNEAVGHGNEGGSIP
jgi:hypothetical protein